MPPNDHSQVKPDPHLLSGPMDTKTSPPQLPANCGTSNKPPDVLERKDSWVVIPQLHRGFSDNSINLLVHTIMISLLVLTFFPYILFGYTNNQYLPVTDPPPTPPPDEPVRACERPDPVSQRRPGRGRSRPGFGQTLFERKSCTSEKSRLPGMSNLEN